MTRRDDRHGYGGTGPSTVRRATGRRLGGAGTRGSTVERQDVLRHGGAAGCAVAWRGTAGCAVAGHGRRPGTGSKTGTARISPRTRERERTRTVRVSLRPGQVSKKVSRGIRKIVACRSKVWGTAPVLIDRRHATVTCYTKLLFYKPPFLPDAYLPFASILFS